MDEMQSHSDNGIIPTASFRWDERFIYICNTHGRSHALIGWTIAGSLITAPILSYWIQGHWGFVDGTGWFGISLYLLGIFGCISAGFWWSKIQIDLVDRRIDEASRWGPFLKRKQATLQLFDHLAVKNAVESGTDVFLEGTKRWCVVWGRTSLETVQIARELSARLKLPLVGGKHRDQ